MNPALYSTLPYMTETDLNADLSKRVAVATAAMPWSPSPSPSVWRKRVHRAGPAESGQVTSVVRYDAGSDFPVHEHPDGEEILVLDGVFQDEHGDFSAGSYIRNPPQSRHTPGSDEGCVILVKLWQFDLADRTHVRIDTNKMAAVPDRDRPGVAVTPLFADGRETVRLERWDAGAVVAPDTDGGAEVFVLVLGAIALAGEATGGTLKMMVPHAYRRSDWILAKGLVLLAVSVCFLLVVARST